MIENIPGAFVMILFFREEFIFISSIIISLGGKIVDVRQKWRGVWKDYIGANTMRRLQLKTFKYFLKGFGKWIFGVLC